MLPHQEVGGAVIYTGDHQGLAMSPMFADPTYHLCVASDKPVDTLQLSIFDGGALLSTMERRLDDLQVAEHRINALSRQLSDLRQSLSYRVGSALLYPLKLLARRKT